MDSSSNDNDLNKGNLGEADSHGHAALLLTESLMHSLVDNSTMKLAEAQNVVTIAIDATAELAHEFPARPDSLERSISLLNDIKLSLGGDE